MPELPEVETIKRQLEKMIVGKTIADIEVRNEKSFIGNPSTSLRASREELIGKKITGVERFGKMIHIVVSGEKDLLVHLKMTGQLIFVDKIKNQKSKIKDTNQKSKVNNEINLPGKATRVIFTFTDNSHLYFNDNRKFGWVRTIESQKSNLKSQKYNSKVKSEIFKNLGVEPFSDDFSTEYLKKITSGWKRAIKILLMEQTKIAGLGNIYATEALFLTGIHPQRPGNSLTPKEIKSLYNSILAVLKEGIDHEGSSVKDKGYVSALGEYGRHQNYLKVYQREGEKCFECGSIIERTVIGGRGTFFCRKCQK